MSSGPAQLYQAEAARCLGAHAALSRRYNLLSWLRLAVFAGGAAGAYALFRIDFWAGMPGAAAALGLFFYLIWRHNEVAAARELLQIQADLCAQELEMLRTHRRSGPDGSAWADPAHPFSADLDLFGPRSLYQFLSRPAVAGGAERLAQRLQTGFRHAAEIREAQDAVRALAARPELLLRFEALGRRTEDAPDTRSGLLHWLAQPARLPLSGVWPLIFKGMPILLAVSVLGWVFPLSPWLTMLPPLLFLLGLGLTAAFLPAVNAIHAGVSRRSPQLRTYTALLAEIEAAQDLPPRLAALRERLTGGPEPASAAIGLLGSLGYRLDQRLNPFSALLLNGAALWDLRQALALERWKAAHRDAVPGWLDALDEWDATASLARFAFHFPGHAWPEVLEGEPCFEAEDLAHPLLLPEGRVANSLLLQGAGQLRIVTGANMAGKSTFLRAAGVNLLLAQAGAPVCARAMRFTPMPLITSMRASDSLADHASYFFAEIRRLRQVIDLLEQEGRAFVLVDEMLRGTNSRDKQTGSMAFVRKLARSGALGLVATHDLVLAELEGEFPGQVLPLCFEIDIREDALTFDYRLRPGVSQTLNAVFLMRQMGIME
ncbi:MAG: hypothetical protein NW241_14795 [Bacteroidia bacterium]|nr:hypothetical protein [Bacteroidia bacterium]